MNCTEIVDCFPVYSTCSDPGRRQAGQGNDAVGGGWKGGGAAFKYRSAPLPGSSASVSHPEHTYITSA